MSDSSCRAPRLAALASLSLVLSAVHVLSVSAQSDDEIIVDPELGDAPSSGDDDEQVVQDDELGASDQGDNGWGVELDVQKKSARGPVAGSSSESDYDPLANTGIAKLEVVGQFAADLHHEEDLEDAYETRLRFDAEIDFRRSRRVRLSVGLRTDLFWAMPSRNDGSLPPVSAEDPEGPRLRAIDQDRFELDLIPLSAFVDTTIGAGFHVRIGEQIVSTARMDFYSPIDILAVADYRGQPRLDVASVKLAQPAVRVDWDLSSWATLQAIYVPWFMPNLSRPNRDLYVATRLTGRPIEEGDMSMDQVGSRSPLVEGLIDPSFQTYASESVFRFVGPAPDFTTPQVQARLALRGSAYELGFSAGTALEKMPSIYLTPLAQKIAQGDFGRITNGDVAARLPIFSAEYHRFHLFGVDGSFDIYPITIGFELAYSPERHLYAATFDGSRVPQPNVTEEIVDPRVVDINDPTIDSDDELDPGNVSDRSIRKGTPLVQGALHIEWLKGETFALALEGFWVNALELPYDQSRDWIGFWRGKGAFAGGLLGLMYVVNDGQWRFQSSLVGLKGPSLIWMPQIELRVLESFFVNVGGQIYEGPNAGRGGRQDLTIGGLLNGYDQVFVGFRYVP
jgi:hypothetical protein